MDRTTRVLHALENRLLNAIGRGVLTSVDDSRSLQIVELDGMPGEELKGVERIQNFGFTSHPKVGSHAVLVFPHGDRGHGIVVAMDDADARLRDLAPGDVAVHDGRGNVVRLTEDGITIESASSVKIEAADDIELSAGGSIMQQAGGAVAQTAGGSISQTAGGSIQIGGSTVTVTAESIASILAAIANIDAGAIGLLSAKTVVAQVLDLLTHTHTAVESGTDTSGPPVPTG